MINIKEEKRLRKYRFFRLALFSLALVGCTRTCVGMPELGSKGRPVSFYVAGVSSDLEGADSLKQSASFDATARCLEQKSGYRVSFEIVSDEKAIYSALSRGDADISLTSALSYLDFSTRVQVQALSVVALRGETLTRSVIVGKASRWRTSLSAQGLTLSAVGLKADSALRTIDSGRFVFVSPESDVGFLVPRHMMLQKNIFPDEAIFAGSEELVLQSLDRDLAIAGSVSESYIEQNYDDATPVQIGSLFGSFVTLAVSPGLPAKVVVVRQNLPQRVMYAMQSGLDECAKGADKMAMESIFGGDGFFKSSDRLFEFLREIQDFRNEFVRVLSPQEP